jgi:hypothetical protein
MYDIDAFRLCHDKTAGYYAALSRKKIHYIAIKPVYYIMGAKQILKNLHSLSVKLMFCFKTEWFAIDGRAYFIGHVTLLLFQHGVYRS